MKRKEQAMNLIKPYYRYVNEVVSLKSSLESIRKMVLNNDFEIYENKIVGNFITKNKNVVKSIFEIKGDTIYFEFIGSRLHVKKEFKKISDGVWIKGETFTEFGIQSEFNNKISKVNNKEVSIRAFKDGLETAKIIENIYDYETFYKKNSHTTTGRTVLKRSYYLCGNNLYFIHEKNGNKRYYKIKNYFKDIIYLDACFKETKPFNIDDYVMKKV